MRKGTASFLVAALVALLIAISFSTPALAVAAPSEPRSLSAISSDAEVKLIWLAPLQDHGGAVINYTIYRSLTPGTEVACAR